MSPEKLLLPERRHVLLAAVKHQAPPVTVLQQEPAIRLPKVLDPEFDEAVVRDCDVLQEPFDDTVLAPLRRNAELRLRQVVDFGRQVGSRLPPLNERGSRDE